MGIRRKARILTLQALYAWELSRPPTDFLLTFPWLDEKRKEEMEEETLVFSRLLIAGALEHIEEIDKTISIHLENWEFGRIAKVDLAILRMSVYSLKYMKDIPPSVTIDEAIDISKEYCGDDSYRFINGVLDGIRKEIVL